MLSCGVEFGNLAQRHWEEVPERDQARVMDEDHEVRIVYDFRQGHWALIRRCGVGVDFVVLAGFEMTPGWHYLRGFGDLPRPDSMAMVKWMREHDMWAQHNDRTQSICDYVNDVQEDFEQKQTAERKQSISDAGARFMDRLETLPRSSKYKKASAT